MALHQAELWSAAAVTAMGADTKFCIVLHSPVPLRTFVKVTVHLKWASPPQSRLAAEQDPAEVHRNVEQLCQRLNTEQPGGPQVAVPADSQGCCQIICLKVPSCLAVLYVSQAIRS